MDKLDHSYFKKIKINSVITNVAIGRTLEIKILGINEWIRAGGCKLELSENQIELKESFLEGDSIFKIENSNKFIIIRNSEKFNWTIK